VDLAHHLHCRLGVMQLHLEILIPTYRKVGIWLCQVNQWQYLTRLNLNDATWHQYKYQVTLSHTLVPSAAVTLPSSSMWNRRFSSKIIEPGAGLAQAASTLGPTQSSRNRTSLEILNDECCEPLRTKLNSVFLSC